MTKISHSDQGDLVPGVVICALDIMTKAGFSTTDLQQVLGPKCEKWRCKIEAYT